MTSQSSWETSQEKYRRLQEIDKKHEAMHKLMDKFRSDEIKFDEFSKGMEELGI